MFDLFDITLPSLSSSTTPADGDVGIGDVSTMWKLWFPDDSPSATGDGSLDAIDYDIERILLKNADRSGTARMEQSVAVPSLPPANQVEAGWQSTATRKQATSDRLVYACVICSRVFTSEKYLSMHVALHRKSATQHDQFPASVVDLMTSSAVNKIPANVPAPSQKSASSSSSSSASSAATASAAAGNRTKWTCEVCFKSFAQNSNYKNHIRTHSDERPFVCHVCSIGFKERYHLKKHTLFKHTGELNEACRQCGKRFKDSTAVRAHERIHSDHRPYSCVRCGKAFKTSECLWHHDHRSKTCGRNKHFGVSQNSRRTADRWANSGNSVPAASSTATTTAMSNMARSTGLDAAPQFHPQIYPFNALQPAAVSQSPAHGFLVTRPSSFVKQELTLPLTMTTNVKSEMSNMSMTTTSCYIPKFIPDSVYAQSATTRGIPVVHSQVSGLLPWTQQQQQQQPATSKPIAVVVAQHMMTSPSSVAMPTLKPTTTHNNKQRAVCSRCGKQFASPLAFERHLAVHSETRPYRCQLCDVGFKLKVHLKKHNLYRHNTEYPCRCGVCGKPFKDSSAVRLHERIHSTARPFQCACGKSFKTRENLWGHRHRRPCAGRFGVGPNTAVAATIARTQCRDVGTLTSFPVGDSDVTGFSTVPVSIVGTSECKVSNHIDPIVSRASGLSYTELAGIVTGETVACPLVPRDNNANIANSLPPFETFVPSPLQACGRQLPVSFAVGGKHVNDVVMATVKLPCIEQLFDRSAWLPTNVSCMTSSRQHYDVTPTPEDTSQCVPVACWDADALWVESTNLRQLID